MNHCFTAFLPFLPLYLRGKKTHPLTCMLSFQCGHGTHVWSSVSTVPSNCDTWQHHTNPSSAHWGCYLLFINTMQTVKCGCIYNRKKNKGPEKVNTSFIIPFVWCVHCVLFLVHRTCLTVLQKGEEPFLELLFCL